MCVYDKVECDKWSVTKWSVRGGGAEADGRDTEPKTRTPHKDVGKIVYLTYHKTISTIVKNMKPDLLFNRESLEKNSRKDILNEGSVVTRMNKSLELFPDNC